MSERGSNEPGERPFHAVLGGGLSGLLAGLRALRNDPAAPVAVIERQPRPGGSAETRRTEGFVLECGPFAFARAELEPFLSALSRPPAVVPALPAVASGWRWDGARLQEAPIAEPPLSFAGGAEDLVQALRRELGAALQLGRAATGLRPLAGGGFEVLLGGDPPAGLIAGRATVALPADAAAALLAAFAPRPIEIGARLRREPRAFAFLGFDAAAAGGLTGYGVLADPAAAAAEGAVEAIFCTNVFPRRALPGRALVRVELAGALIGGAGDQRALAAAESALRRWTGLAGRITFARLHRFTVLVRDAAWVECRTRLRGLADVATGLAFAE